MPTCETHGHIFGHDAKCLFCKTPKPEDSSRTVLPGRLGHASWCAHVTSKGPCDCGAALSHGARVEYDGMRTHSSRCIAIQQSNPGTACICRPPPEPSVKPCCLKFDTCTERCTPLVTELRRQIDTLQMERDRISDEFTAYQDRKSPGEPADEVRLDHRYCVGDPVSIHAPDLMRGMPRVGWVIESVPQNQLFVLKHPDGHAISMTRFDFSLTKTGDAP